MRVRREVINSKSVVKRRHGRFPRRVPCRVLNHALASPSTRLAIGLPRSHQQRPLPASFLCRRSQRRPSHPARPARLYQLPSRTPPSFSGCVRLPFSKLRRPICQHSSHSSCYGSTAHAQRSVSAGLAKDGHPWEHIPDSRLLISITRRTRGPPPLGSCSMPRPLCDMIGRPPPGTCNSVGICPEPVTGMIFLEAFHPHIRSVSLPHQVRFTSNSTLIRATRDPADSPAR
ncbi:hypothetical protein GY45DRAFT_702653 [Cubamyces sp. BRFM 1775]|nr:hypothetical protein GY45DRAFT_702653 [Cubamyces sp. BRFM 1775]